MPVVNAAGLNHPDTETSHSGPTVTNNANDRNLPPANDDDKGSADSDSFSADSDSSSSDDSDGCDSLSRWAREHKKFVLLLGVVALIMVGGLAGVGIRGCLRTSRNDPESISPALQSVAVPRDDIKDAQLSTGLQPSEPSPIHPGVSREDQLLDSPPPPPPSQEGKSAAMDFVDIADKAAFDTIVKNGKATVVIFMASDCWTGPYVQRRVSSLDFCTSVGHELDMSWRDALKATEFALVDVSKAGLKDLVVEYGIETLPTIMLFDKKGNEHGEKQVTTKLSKVKAIVEEMDKA